MRWFSCAAWAVAALAWSAPALAGSLQISPLSLEAPAPATATLLTLRTEAPRPISAQVRVFRWTQTGGREELVPETRVVASPPVVQLTPRQDYSVRLIRIGNDPVRAEESYRVVVSELPEAPRPGSAAINMLVNYSIPLFFLPPRELPAQLTWRGSSKGGQFRLDVANMGGRRVRLTQVRISDGRSTATLSDGLLGYALAGSAMSWQKPVPRTLGPGPWTITATTDSGVIDGRVDPAP